jgi:hypothetical protein
MGKSDMTLAYPHKSPKTQFFFIRRWSGEGARPTSGHAAPPLRRTGTPACPDFTLRVIGRGLQSPLGQAGTLLLASRSSGKQRRGGLPSADGRQRRSDRGQERRDRTFAQSHARFLTRSGARLRTVSASAVNPIRFTRICIRTPSTPSLMCCANRFRAIGSDAIRIETQQRLALEGRGVRCDFPRPQLSASVCRCARKTLGFTPNPAQHATRRSVTHCSAIC